MFKKCIDEQRRLHENHVAYRLALIHPTCSWNLQSELKVTHENAPTALPRFKNVIFRHHYIMLKNSSYIETEKSYLCKVLHFNRQNLLIDPPNDWVTAYGSYWKCPSEHYKIVWDMPRKVFVIWRRQLAACQSLKYVPDRGSLGERSCPRSTLATHSVSVNWTHNFPVERRIFYHWAIAGPAKSSSPMLRCQENVMCSWGVTEKPTIREKGLR